jgi:hypothetical protein
MRFEFTVLSSFTKKTLTSHPHTVTRNSKLSHEVFLFTHPLRHRLGTITAHQHLSSDWPYQRTTAITAI